LVDPSVETKLAFVSGDEVLVSGRWGTCFRHIWCLEERKNVADESGQSIPEPGQPEQPGQSEQQEQPVPQARRRPKVPLEVQEQRLTPRPSLWPIALAFALVFTAIGVIVNPVLLICGIVVTIIVIVGWFLERR
jgi:Cytochrome c oxidase subunit IV